jgi:hypothetical protein
MKLLPHPLHPLGDVFRFTGNLIPVTLWRYAEMYIGGGLLVVILLVILLIVLL